MSNFGPPYCHQCGQSAFRTLDGKWWCLKCIREWRKDQMQKGRGMTRVVVICLVVAAITLLLDPLQMLVLP